MISNSSSEGVPTSDVFSSSNVTKEVNGITVRVFNDD